MKLNLDASYEIFREAKETIIALYNICFCFGDCINKIVPRLNYNRRGVFMKIKRRITIVLICFMSVMFVLLCRLIQIQIIDTESFTDRKINLIEKVLRNAHNPLQ